MASAGPERMRIGLVAPPFERVPPVAYGGTERIVQALAIELDRRGHAVTVFASGDSIVPGRLVATVPLPVRESGAAGIHAVTVSHVSAKGGIVSAFGAISKMVALKAPAPRSSPLAPAKEGGTRNNGWV